MKIARGMLENPMQAGMLCGLQPNQHRETCGTVGQLKTKYACIVEADESMRIRMEGSQSKNHVEHISGKGVNSLSHKNLVHKFFLCLKLWKCQKQRQQWRKNLKIGENTAWQLTKVKNKSEVIAEAWNKRHIVHFASLMDLCHLKNKGRVVLPGDTVKDDSGSFTVFS